MNTFELTAINDGDTVTWAETRARSQLDGVFGSDLTFTGYAPTGASFDAMSAVGSTGLAPRIVRPSPTPGRLPRLLDARR